MANARAVFVGNQRIRHVALVGARRPLRHVASRTIRRIGDPSAEIRRRLRIAGMAVRAAVRGHGGPLRMSVQLVHGEVGGLVLEGERRPGRRVVAITAVPRGEKMSGRLAHCRRAVVTAVTGPGKSGVIESRHDPGRRGVAIHAIGSGLIVDRIRRLGIRDRAVMAARTRGGRRELCMVDSVDRCPGQCADMTRFASRGRFHLDVESIGGPPCRKRAIVATGAARGDPRMVEGTGRPRRGRVTGVARHRQCARIGMDRIRGPSLHRHTVQRQARTGRVGMTGRANTNNVGMVDLRVRIPGARRMAIGAHGSRFHVSCRITALNGGTEAGLLGPIILVTGNTRPSDVKVIDVRSNGDGPAGRGAVAVVTILADGRRRQVIQILAFYRRPIVRTTIMTTCTRRERRDLGVINIRGQDGNPEQRGRRGLVAGIAGCTGQDVERSLAGGRRAVVTG